jgi:hypothetical protein
MRQANRQLHSDPEYGQGGVRWSYTVRDIMQRGKCASVLDYGCGKGGLKKALPAHDVREYDPAIPGKDGPPEPADFVLCADVLEHVEPEYLDEVLDHIKVLARKFVMLSPSTVPALKTYPDGRNAHLIVQPPEWWREQFEKRFVLMQEDTRGLNYTFFGKPKETA